MTKPSLNSDNWTNPFIVRGGGACPAFIKARPGVHPEVFFRFRRASAQETEDELVRIKSLSGSRCIDEMQSFLAQSLVSWSLGCTPDLERVQMLCQPLVVAMFYIAVGVEPAGDIPEEYLKPGERQSSEDSQKKS